MPKVLVTGFEPFGGETINSSLAVLEQLPAEPGELRIVTRVLPTVFGRSVEVLRAAIIEVMPDLVVAIGEAGGRAELSVERVAVNLDDAPIPDNAGRQPIDRPIIPGAPAAYFSTLPVKAIIRDLRQAGLPAAVSGSAGTFVCNHVFFALMHMLATEWPGRRGGFVHLPYLPDQAARHPGAPAMAVELMVQGVQIILVAAARAEADIVAGEGIPA